MKTMTCSLTLATIEWRYLLGTTPWEIAATACAVLGVFLIARQNVLGWPLGIAWAAISAVLAFTVWDLVSDGILYVSYIPIQVYCWSVWVRRDAEPQAAFRPTWLPRKTQVFMAGAAAISVVVWALSIAMLGERVAWIPAPALLWRDSTTTVLNYFAQFLQARKRMENWVGWLIVNLLGIHIYWVKDAPIYAVQYAFFLALGIYGWSQWRKFLPTNGD